MKIVKSKRGINFLNTGIFNATILFSNGFEYDDLISYLNKIKAFNWAKSIENDKQLIDNSNWVALRRSYKKNKNNYITYFYIILKNPFLYTDYDYCKLAHEVLHICQFLLPDILDRNREYECEAYLHTHLMQQCLNSLK